MNAESSTIKSSLLAQMAALADPTRLRLLLLIANAELNLTDLCQVVEQSQPRVSRHLKILVNAQLVTKNRQGHNVFFAVGMGPEAANALVDYCLDHPYLPSECEGDKARLQMMLTIRDSLAQSIVDNRIKAWRQSDHLIGGEHKVVAQILREVAEQQPQDVIDIGCGAGSLLPQLAAHSRRVIGYDIDADAVEAARSKVNLSAHTNIRVRQGNMNSLPADDHSADVLIFQHVLHFAGRPIVALDEADRILRPGGHLLIADYCPHENAHFKEKFGHLHLGFDADQRSEWAARLGMALKLHVTPPSEAPQIPCFLVVLQKPAPSTHSALGQSQGSRR